MFNNIRKTMHEQNENFNKEIENIKKDQTNFGAEECSWKIHWNEKFTRGSTDLIKQK